MDLGKAKSIEITDKPLFDKYFKKYPPEISELTFTNLFIWRFHYNFLYLEWNEHLIIFSEEFLKNKLYFLPPIGASPDEIVLNLLENLESVQFNKVPNSIIEKIDYSIQENDLNLQIIEDRDNWDYIYEVESLINLAGNKYRQNRRWLNKFLENYDYEFHVMTDDSIEKVKELQLDWCIMRGCEEEEDLSEEQTAIDEALDNFDSLGYLGAYICVDDKCVAYTLGELLNAETLVIHIEKAHTHFEGSYQAINNLFLKHCSNNAQFVNREQDLGILGLRRAKESYKPVRMIEKSIIFQKF